MIENQHSPEEEPVCTTWARLVEVVLGLFLIVGTGVMAHYYAPPAPLPVPAPTPVRPVSSTITRTNSVSLRVMWMN